MDNKLESDLCVCPGCDEESGAGHGASDHLGHRFCYSCHLAGCSGVAACCLEPECGCTDGWAIFNGDPDSDYLGVVQRCDSCRVFPNDEEAWRAAMAAGYLVDGEGTVIRLPSS